MSKKHRKKKPLRSKQRSQRTSKELTLNVVKMRITRDPLLTEDFEALPDDVQARIQHLYALKNSEPEQAIRELMVLREQYPHIPTLYNYLAQAYFLLNDIENAEKITLEECRKFPDYLFARLDYVRLCLIKGELEKIPEIFETFLLQKLYPERSVFHISEVLNFNYLMAIYFIKIGNTITANAYYQEMKYFAPEDRMTKQLATRLKR